MNTRNHLRYFPLGALTLSIAVGAISCSSGSKRGPASLPPLSPTEKTQKAGSLFASNDPIATAVFHADRFLKIQYRAEAGLMAFEEKLAQLLREKRAKPNSESNALKTDEYQLLYRAWIASRNEIDEVTETYENALKTSSDPNSPERVTAEQVVENLHKWTSELSEADRLQVVELLRALREIKSRNDAVASLKQKDQTKGERQVASMPEAPDWLKDANFEEQYKRNRQEIERKAKEAAQWKDPELDGQVQYRFDENPGREPNSANARRFAPSAGREGNIIGTELPGNTVVFTFDDGPGEASTRRLHQVLTTYKDPVNTTGVPASFFVLSQRLLADRATFNETKRLGFKINNHSYTHANFAKASESKLEHEIYDSHKVLASALGSKYRFFRCPYGACIAPAVPEAREMIARIGLIHAYWSIDSLDWKNIGRPQRTANLVINQLRLSGRGLILMHDIHESTIDAAKIVLDYIKSRNQSGGRLRLINLETAVDELNR